LYIPFLICYLCCKIREYDRRWMVWFVSFVVWSVNMVVKSCEKIVRQSFGQMIESEFVFFAICEGSIGTRIIFHNTYLIVLCFHMFFTLEGCWLPLSDRFYDFLFFFISILFIYPLVIRVDKKKELKIWPQLSQDWPIHYFNNMILFHFCWFWCLIELNQLDIW